MDERLPPEICTEILIRLPVKSLLRFRCVSKSWRTRIDSPSFIKAHLKKSTETNSTLSLIVSESNPDFLCWVNFDSLNTTLEHNAISFHELDYPLTGPSDASHNIKIVGSCNGVLCFGNAAGSIVLMNPSTRKHYILPFLVMDAYANGRNRSSWGAWAFGFGYDSVNDDCKVVRLGQYICLNERYFETETMVYGLKSNSWRKIQGMSYILGFDQKMGVLVGNALHWLVDRNQILLNPGLIVAFDLGIEDFREVPGPELVVADQNQNPSLNLGVVEEWLSLCAIYEGVQLDIWVMKEYGVKDSWTRLFSFTPNEVPSVKLMRTLTFSKNGDELLLGLKDGNLISYKVKEKGVKRVAIHTVATLFVAEVFHGSLVPLNVKKETDSKKPRPRKGSKDRDEFLSKGFKLVI